MMAQKLGFKEFDSAKDKELIDELLAVLQLSETDMTIFFRDLADVSIDGRAAADGIDATQTPFDDAYYQADPLPDEQRDQTLAWLRRYIDRLLRDGTPDRVRRERMNAVNPKYVLRNYLAQMAIDKSEVGDHSMVNELLEVLRRPYDEQPGKEEFAKKRPEWARHRAGCSMLSCSS